MTYPVILAFNIRQSVFKNFGLTLYKHAKQIYNMHLLPIVTVNQDGIEQRALKISQELPKFLQKNKIQSAHIAAYSSCGIDFRFAISQLGISKHVKTLTTISSPHKGSKLATLSDRKFFKEEITDPISRLSGIGLRAFHQFVPENMRHFNNYIKDSPNIQYYSLGSEKLPNLCSYSLKDTGKYLLLKTQTNFQYHNDGVFGHDQVVWANHITNFEADHGQVIGIYGPKRSNALRTVNEIAQDWQNRQPQAKKSWF